MKLFLEDLVRRAARKLTDEPELRGHLEVRQLTGCVLAQIVDVGRITARHNDNTHSFIENRLRDAEVEVEILAIVCMYGMYLHATGGKKKSTKITVHRADGSYEVHEIVDYADSLGPLRAIAGLFRQNKSGNQD